MASALRTQALQHAERLGFTRASDDATGRLLAVLAAALPHGGRILELGTGTGVGLASLVDGLGERRDAQVVTIEMDPRVAAAAAQNRWPAHVQLLVGDALSLLPSLGRFELVFADAQGGKWTGLDLTIAALQPRGLLLVDDMTTADTDPPELRSGLAAVRDTLLAHPRLLCCELQWSTGLILCASR